LKRLMHYCELCWNLKKTEVGLNAVSIDDAFACCELCPLLWWKLDYVMLEHGTWNFVNFVCVVEQFEPIWWNLDLADMWMLWAMMKDLCDIRHWINTHGFHGRHWMKENLWCPTVGSRCL
jgi:hypothetical protein